MFNFRYEKVGKDQDIVAVVLTGTLEEENCEYLMSCLQDEILEGRTKLILDCEHLNFISSMGLGMLVRIHSRMKKLGGEVKIAAVQGTVAKVMSLVGLNRMFHIHPTVADAITSHGG
jgi:anti-anti-sigma factor